MSSEKNETPSDNLIRELTNYKGLIIQLTAFMFHSNNLYADDPSDPWFHHFVDYSIKVVLYILFAFSFTRIVLVKLVAIQESWQKIDKVIKGLFIFCILPILILVVLIFTFLSHNSN